MNLYEKWKDWTSTFKRTDIVRAIFGIVFVFAIFFLLFGLAGCSNLNVNRGPELSIGSSHRGDGFIEVNQNIWQSSTNCTPTFVLKGGYIHHSEIFKETDEDVYDGGRLMFTTQFGAPWIK